MRIGLSLKLSEPKYNVLAQNIRALFADGSQGWWYDDDDLTTLFQDSAGTTPVTAVEQFVGLQLDKSRGLVVGSTIATYDFASATGWSTVGTVAITGGEVVFTAAIDQRGIYRADAIFSVAQYYEITFTITSISSGAISVSVGQSSGNTQPKSTAGTHTVRMYGTGADNYVRIYSVGASTTASVDNVIIKVIPGNHRYAPASGNRPIWSKRVNLLTYTEQFDDAYWTKTRSSITPNATTAPNGTLTADKLVEDTSTNDHFVRTTSVVSVPSGVAHTFSMYAKQAERTFLAVFLSGVTATGVTSFDLSTGSIAATSPNATATINDAGNGWYRCSVTVVTNSTSINIFCYPNLGGTSYTGNGTSGIFIWGADLRPANQATGTMPLYQRVNTATDYDTNGFPGYLKADGIDDFLQTNSIDFTATDKVTLCAGVRKLSDAPSIITESSTNAASTSGAFFIAHNGTGAPTGYNAITRGSGYPGEIGANGYVAPVTNVLALLGNISGDSEILRINGAQVASSSADQGTGNFGNYPAYFFRRGGTTLPFNGNEYGNIAVGKLLTADQLTALETYMNGLTKAY